MPQSIVFFDIDGTLWDKTNNIEESTAQAIKLLKANGHKTFINSGRTRSFIIAPNLLDLGFDGIVSGCGTMIEMDGEVVFEHSIDKDLAVYTVETLREQNVHIILEGRGCLYMDYDYFLKDEYGQRLMQQMNGNIYDTDAEWGKWKMSKMSLVLDNTNIDILHEKLDKYYNFMQHTPTICELVPWGYDKGTGIKKTCEITGIPIENTFAFGDSINDIEMMQTAGHPIAMGNGTDEIKAMCEYVTTNLYDNGIWNGCKKYGLI